MSHVVVVSGPVGVGKTAVARALVAAPRTPAIFIEGDKFWPFIVKGQGVRNDHREYEKFYALFDADERRVIADDDSDLQALARRTAEGVAAGTYLP